MSSKTYTRSSITCSFYVQHKSALMQANGVKQQLIMSVYYKAQDSMKYKLAICTGMSKEIYPISFTINATIKKFEFLSSKEILSRNHEKY